ncbi:MAG: response regulator transcription factor [Bacteroidota bacterium]
MTLYNASLSRETDDQMQSIRVVIADDHHLFIAGLKTILGNVEGYDFSIVGVAHNGTDLLPILKRTRPELLLLDLNMPERDGLDVLGVIREEYRDMHILALTMYDEAKIIKSAFKSGVDGYVLKNVGKNELVRAISEVMKGNTFLGEGVKLSAIIETVPKHTEAGLFFEDKFIKKYNLTKRELEILRLISQAMSNKEIAKELYISDQTVSVHRKNIMRKLGVSNTAGLIKIAYDNSLI